MKDTFSCRYTEYRVAVADADTLSVHSERFIEISRAEKRLSQLFSAWEQLQLGKVCIEIWSNSYGLHLLPPFPLAHVCFAYFLGQLLLHFVDG